ncbi:putative bifunctional diguanylate cyclase/phosphodiesterase [Deinococcus frigens]|uniref:putative bifunctional diguanylate cyclase/phosphodiesterase n=1 Tax=Deinococcus frigens TaxID=249403 RepID=UPI0006905599|nr:EAL domain-containing protein [Deinococcus frigens]
MAILWGTVTPEKLTPEQGALRTEARRRLARLAPLETWEGWEAAALIHELRVQHVEIELQNEELQHSVADLEFERRHYHTLYQHAPSAYFTLNAAGDILDVNLAGTRLLGFQRDQLLLRPFRLFLVPEQRAEFASVLATLTQTQSTRTHLFTLEQRDGERLEVQLQGLTLPSPAQEPPSVLITLMDITPLSQARAHLEHLNATLEHRVSQDTRALLDLNAQLHHQARHDFLTGLPNRAAFADALRGALDGLHQHGQDFAVLFFDIDRFKVINDSLGHPAGDHVLVELSRRLREVTRPEDDLSRLGGDEFAILLHSVTDPDIISGVIARLDAAVQHPLVLEGQELYLTVSTGILLVGDGYHTAEEVVRDVDVALYQAKRGGNAGSKVFVPSMRDEARGQLELEAQLRHALERHELVVHYQPIVALESGQVLGLEALVRWQHPQRGLLLPGVFIPLAEALELVGEIDRWVLMEAQRQTARWRLDRARAHPLWMNVNVAAQNLEQIRQVTDQLLIHASPAPWRVLVEITERVLTSREEGDPGTLEALRLAQVELVLDDFGMGFSSLSALHRFPVRMLKIDRSFVMALGENASLIRAIVLMGEALGLTVVAEGVETQEHQRGLLELGLKVAQGWLFAAALPPEEAEAYLRTNHRLE